MITDDNYDTKSCTEGLKFKNYTSHLLPQPKHILACENNVENSPDNSVANVATLAIREDFYLHL